MQPRTAWTSCERFHNELDPATGRILNKFTALNEPHEGVGSHDGKTFYTAIPNGPHVAGYDPRAPAPRAHHHATPIEILGESHPQPKGQF